MNGAAATTASASAGAHHYPSWRVREMALRVVARHRLGEALTAAAELQQDPVARVRAAALRPLVRLATHPG
ncbi:MAG: hypothetical protein M3N95_10630 [Actinomycetota bacterium]|nr:hypothetical protein [Actinomycetota bacterium]